MIRRLIRRLFFRRHTSAPLIINVLYGLSR